MPRLDQELVNRGLSPSRARAQSAIKNGYVRMNDKPILKPSQDVGSNDIITINDPTAQWVSRAALKILPFLDIPANAIALDLGASTGGFTQALLHQGAVKVFAVDVGHDQLHPNIAKDPRVIALENFNVKDLNATSFSDSDWPNFQIITADLSFISLKKALPAALELAPKNTQIYALIKPQFELAPARIGKGGLVKNPEDGEQIAKDISQWFEAKNWTTKILTPAPIKGGDGNQEYIIKAIKK